MLKSLHTCRAMLLAVAIGAALAAPAEAAPIFIDFGSSFFPIPASENYNHIVLNVTPQVTVIPDLIDNTGASTGIGLDVTPQAFPKNGFEGENIRGTDAPTGAAAIFHPTATLTNVFASGTSSPSAELRFTGLGPDNTYDFVFFASRLDVGDNRETEYVVSGLNSGSALLDAANNTSDVATVLGIRPNAMGEINVLVDPGPNNTNASQFYYLAALRLQCIPEPASGVLLLLGAVSVFMVQRHRGAGRRT